MDGSDLQEEEMMDDGIVQTLGRGTDFFFLTFISLNHACLCLPAHLKMKEKNGVMDLLCDHDVSVLGIRRRHGEDFACTTPRPFKDTRIEIRHSCFGGVGVWASSLLDIEGRVLR